MRRLLPWLLVLLFLPACALAAPETPYAPDTVIQVDALTPEALALLDVIYPALRSCEASIALPSKTLYDDASAAMQCLSRNYPELFHLDRTWSIGYYQNTPEYAAWIEPSYSMTAGDYEAVLAQLLTTAQSFVSSADGFQTDRAEQLHDLLCQRTAYDPIDDIGSEDAGDDRINNSAVGALLMGVTRCEGYANALALLYRLAGIPCGVVTGTSLDEQGVSRHAWNIAVIDGTSTLIDATWNDQDDSGYVTHWYYGLTTDMIAMSHLPDPELSVPVCDSTAVNWHARRGLLAASSEDIMVALRLFVRDGEVSIRFADAALYADFRNRTNDWISDYNASCPQGEAFYGAYSFIYSDEQCCIQLWSGKEDTTS